MCLHNTYVVGSYTLHSRVTSTPHTHTHTHTLQTTFFPTHMPGPAASSGGVAGGTVVIETKGTCAMCGNPVYSHQKRAKQDGAYLHMTCVDASEAQKVQEREDVHVCI